MDWRAWHDDYDVPDSPLSRRLRAVHEQVRAALDAAPPGPLRAVSACAGEGRDLLGVLAEHPRRGDVTARLVELDPLIAARAGRTAGSMGLDRVEVVVGDAGLTSHYRGAVPADLVLLCGVFGLARQLWLAVAFLVLGGGALFVLSVFRGTILQAATTDEMRGRMQGALAAVAAGSPRVADIVHGLVGAAAGTTLAIVGGGLLTVAAMVTAAAAFPEFWRYRAAVERDNRVATRSR